MTTLRRVEWRGDLFASELPGFLERLAGARAQQYDLPHTLTLFLQREGQPLEVEHALRIRAYGRLPDFSAESVRAAIEAGLAGKLQIKDAGGAVTELAGGRVSVLSGARLGRSGAGLWRVRLGAGEYVAASVRVARRTHHELDLEGGRVRVTVDHERRLFRLQRHAARCLGDMGPRVEIKAARGEDAARARERLDPEGRLRRVPYRSLELLFQEALRGSLAAETHLALPEIEVKFELCQPAAERLAGERLGALVPWLAGAGSGPRLPGGPVRLLLPFPHQIVRLRRYHLCAPGDGERRVIVETAAGRLSAKVKRRAELRGPALLRATSASHSTDRDGVRVSPEEFAAARAWTRHNVMDKLQAKLPFALASGRAYQLSVDDCRDEHGLRLRQVELEYIGTRGAVPGADEVCAEIAALASALRSGPAGALLVPSTRSKSEVFERLAAR